MHKNNICGKLFQDEIQITSRGVFVNVLIINVI